MANMKADMVHSDIKPQNVLVFRDRTGLIFAKLADFGYAGWALDENAASFFKPPRSRPWDAPEYHHRGFSIAQAKKMDIFSFSMLCMWVLFEDKLTTGTLASTEVFYAKDAFMPVTGQTGAFRDLGLIDELKHGDRLLALAHSLVKMEKRLNESQVRSLANFFNSAPAHDPERRASDMEQLTFLLSQDWYVEASMEYRIYRI
jgi:serine/threonine protein kinase